MEYARWVRQAWGTYPLIIPRSFGCLFGDEESHQHHQLMIPLTMDHLTMAGNRRPHGPMPWSLAGPAPQARQNEFGELSPAQKRKLQMYPGTTRYSR